MFSVFCVTNTKCTVAIELRIFCQNFSTLDTTETGLTIFVEKSERIWFASVVSEVSFLLPSYVPCKEIRVEFFDDFRV